MISVFDTQNRVYLHSFSSLLGAATAVKGFFLIEEI